MYQRVGNDRSSYGKLLIALISMHMNKQLTCQTNKKQANGCNTKETHTMQTMLMETQPNNTPLVQRFLCSAACYSKFELRAAYCLRLSFRTSANSLKKRVSGADPSASP